MPGSLLGTPTASTVQGSRPALAPASTLSWLRILYQLGSVPAPTAMPLIPGGRCTPTSCQCDFGGQSAISNYDQGLIGRCGSGGARGLFVLDTGCRRRGPQHAHPWGELATVGPEPSSRTSLIDFPTDKGH